MSVLLSCHAVVFLQLYTTISDPATGFPMPGPFGFLFLFFHDVTVFEHKKKRSLLPLVVSAAFSAALLSRKYTAALKYGGLLQGRRLLYSFSRELQLFFTDFSRFPVFYFFTSAVRTPFSTEIRITSPCDSVPCRIMRAAAVSTFF